jgi:membrane associated rhomboid family serine protease
VFPFSDDTRSYSVPIWIFILIALNTLFYFASTSHGDQAYLQTIFEYGAIPARFYQPASQPLHIEDQQSGNQAGYLLDQKDLAPPLITLFTSTFLHGGLLHLLGNMWFLWIFGDNVEDRFGKLLFPVFYIVCGLLAGALHVLLLHSSTMPTIGASGAIAGIMGAYIYMFPRATVASLFVLGFWGIVHIPAPFYLGLWFLLQLFGGFSGGAANPVAVWAHVGGFLAGLFLAMIFSARGLVNWGPGDRGMPIS